VDHGYTSFIFSSIECNLVFLLFCCLSAGSKQRNVVYLVAENYCCNRFYFADPGIFLC
jgi:hypothetical protein